MKNILNSHPSVTACRLIFIVSGILYGTLAARIPALAMQAGVGPEGVGNAIMSLGLGSLLGFAVVRFFISKFTSRHVASACAVLLPISSVGLCYSHTELGLCAGAAFMGIFIALVDVAMNTQAVLVELKLRKRHLSTMHAFYSLGGFLGALIGSVFAKFGLSPIVNFGALLIVLSPAVILTRNSLLPDQAPAKKEAVKKSGVPVFTIFCGFVALCAYVTEGSVGDWGSLYLHTVKGASEAEAGLAYGIFCVLMAAARFAGDWFRNNFFDFSSVFAGSILALCGFTAVLLSPYVPVCLMGYGAMGLGLAVIVPIVISRAGTRGDVSPSTAATIVSSFGYTGLLVLPPALGHVAAWTNLTVALLIPYVFCVCIIFSSFAFRK